MSLVQVNRDQLEMRISYLPARRQLKSPTPIHAFSIYLALEGVHPVQIDLRYKEDTVNFSCHGPASSWLNFLRRELQQEEPLQGGPSGVSPEEQNISIVQLLADVARLRRLFDMQNRNTHTDLTYSVSTAFKESLRQLQQNCRIPAKLVRVLAELLARIPGMYQSYIHGVR